MYVIYMVMIIVLPKPQIKKCGLTNDVWVTSRYEKALKHFPNIVTSLVFVV